MQQRKQPEEQEVIRKAEELELKAKMESEKATRNLGLYLGGRDLFLMFESSAAEDE